MMCLGRCSANLVNSVNLSGDT